VRLEKSVAQMIARMRRTRPCVVEVVHLWMPRAEMLTAGKEASEWNGRQDVGGLNEADFGNDRGT